MQAAINAALTDLPGDLQSLPRFRKANPAAMPIMILALTSKTMPPSAIYDAADTVIAQRLSQVTGVAEVSVNGAEQPAIRVRVNPLALASMGLDMEAVRTRHRQRQCRWRARHVRRTASGRSPSPPTTSCAPRPEYDPIVVRTANGAVVRLSDGRVDRAEPCATAARPAGSTASPRCCW